jgi:hypothetical protein
MTYTQGTSLSKINYSSGLVYVALTRCRTAVVSTRIEAHAKRYVAIRIESVFQDVAQKAVTLRENGTALRFMHEFCGVNQVKPQRYTHM